MANRSTNIILLLILFSTASSCGNRESRWTYTCDDGYSFTVTFRDNGGGIVLGLPEGLIELLRVVSASGEKYSNGVDTFWAKENNAFIERRCDCT